MDERQSRCLDQLGVKPNGGLIMHRQLGTMSYQISRMTVHVALNTRFPQKRDSYEIGGHGGDAN
jgi:hypothetical protein